MKRIFGQIGRLRKEKVKEYGELHRNAWPGVLDTLAEHHLHNYSIFLHGELAFSYFEYTGENYETDMADMDKDPVMKEWWKHTKPCFEKYAVAPDSEFYCDMEAVFYME